MSVPNIFLPDSEIQYYLNWRNVKRIELALYPVELNRDVKLDERRELAAFHLAQRAGENKILVARHERQGRLQAGQ